MNTWLKSYVDFEENGSNCKTFSLERLEKDFEVRQISGNGYLVLKWDSEKFWLEFAVFEFDSSDIDNKNVALSLIFHGKGAAGYLRECRNTFWGEDGYLYYPNGKIISASFVALSEFFDDMV